MYQYSKQDKEDLESRRKIFQRQLQRHIEGKMSDEEFRPIRLRQGLYIQRHAPMLRVAIPYGMISSTQLRVLAEVAERFDKGYCHITTRQNVQFNWISMPNIPEVLELLATVQMHSIQTSGDCIRNITSDPFAGVASDEIIDPRPYCEFIRQWSLGHPEFAYLPRKFKISITGASQDRAMIQAHDIGLRLKRHPHMGTGFQVIVGGGLGRTPVIGSELSPFIPERYILDYLTAILRVYNQQGRRDNKYKARIKILVKALGIQTFKQQVNEAWQQIRAHGSGLDPSQISSLSSYFATPEYERYGESEIQEYLTELRKQHPDFSNWLERNTHSHKITGYRSVTLSLKGPGNAPGDMTSKQMIAIARLADEYSFGVARTTPEQNLVLADVKVKQLFPLWERLQQLALAAPTIGTLQDIICCPGLDYCSLANTPSLPLANAIQEEFSALDDLYDIGELSLNISGCMNACAHHHLANIGILGVDKKGKPFYQISLGGQKGNETRIGKILGPSFAESDMPRVIRNIVKVYLSERKESERFIDTYSRIGLQAFKEGVYGYIH